MTEWLWTRDAAAAATVGAALGTWDGVSGVSIDTRELAPGDLFVALKGEMRDGHEFVAAALAKGAGAALVGRERAEIPGDLPETAPLLVVADDTLLGLERLAAAARARAEQLTAIAVTGSVGKTSTKDMLAHMLASQPGGPKVHAAARSFNNHWGVPLTLARMPADTVYGVFEIGMNHAGEITPLSRLARPNVAIVTTVEAVHLEAFDGVEGIAEAKAEIFAGLTEGGTAVLFADNPHFDLLRRRAKEAGAGAILTFGEDDGDAKLFSTTIGDAVDGAKADGKNGGALQSGTTVCAGIFSEEALFQIGAPGRHFALNALAALLAVKAAGADISRAALALRDWRAPDGRGARRRIELPQGGAFLLVDESYNANPASMRAALETFAALAPEGAPSGAEGRRLAFLTDMLELGPSEAALHAELASSPALAALDAVHTAGPRMRVLHDGLPESVRGEHVSNAEALADVARRVVQAGDAAMVKGSLGSKAKIVADALRALGGRNDG